MKKFTIEDVTVGAKLWVSGDYATIIEDLGDDARIQWEVSKDEYCHPKTALLQYVIASGIKLSPIRVPSLESIIEGK